MSFVGEPFRHDLFVSYSHGDPKGAGAGPLKHWSQRLVDELCADIQAVDTEFDTLDVSIDRDLDATQHLTGELRQRVQGSALLLVVMSPRYVASSWCKDERNWFEEEVRRRGLEDGCVLVVRCLPTDPDTWPAFLKDERGYTVVGFWFHPRPPDAQTRPYGWPDPQPTDRAFYEALSGLSATVMQRLKLLRQRQALRRQEQAAGPRPGNGRIVYVHARPEHEAAWQRTREELLTAGLAVLPERLDAPGTGLAALQVARRARIAACKDCEALLILRPEPGPWIDAEIEATGHGERADVEAFFGRRLPCAVLDGVGGALPTADQLRIETIPARWPGWTAGLAGWLASARGTG